MDEQAVIILTKQCEIVKTKYEEIDFSDDLWFFERQWSKKQEAEFIEWLTNHLYLSKEARAALMPVPSRNKKMCKRTAEAWAFNYGWKYND